MSRNLQQMVKFSLFSPNSRYSGGSLKSLLSSEKHPSLRPVFQETPFSDYEAKTTTTTIRSNARMLIQSEPSCSLENTGEKDKEIKSGGGVGAAVPARALTVQTLCSIFLHPVWAFYRGKNLGHIIWPICNLEDFKQTNVHLWISLV